MDAQLKRFQSVALQKGMGKTLKEFGNVPWEKYKNLVFFSAMCLETGTSI